MTSRASSCASALLFTALTAFASLVGLVACGATPEDDVAGPDDTRERTTDAGTTRAPRDAGTSTDTGEPGDFASDDAGATDGCPAEAKLIYTIDYGSGDSDTAVHLRRFDPKTTTFSIVGKVACPSESLPNSMAVARDGTAWVLYQDGHLFKVSTKDASCAATSFAPGQQGFQTFGMGFASDGPGSKSETLFIGSYPPFASLGSIALDTLKVSRRGLFTGNLSARAEFSGTGEGRLFGAFEGSPWVVAEVDKKTAAAISKAPQSSINGTNSFAFAAWGGDFWLFVGGSVYRYEPSTGKTAKVATVDFSPVGAGVSTWAPFAPPN